MKKYTPSFDNPRKKETFSPEQIKNDDAAAQIFFHEEFRQSGQLQKVLAGAACSFDCEAQLTEIVQPIRITLKVDPSVGAAEIAPDKMFDIADALSQAMAKDFTVRMDEMGENATQLKLLARPKEQLSPTELYQKLEETMEAARKNLRQKTSSNGKENKL